MKRGLKQKQIDYMHIQGPQSSVQIDKIDESVSTIFANDTKMNQVALQENQQKQTKSNKTKKKRFKNSFQPYPNQSQFRKQNQNFQQQEQVGSQENNQINFGITDQTDSLKSKEQLKFNHQKYRPDIDGLRALAITLVVVFHAYPESLTGGFIGVDVFFVISGFLITSIILKQQYQHKFSFTNFYCRRIKRIYPALMVVMVVAFLIGYFNLDSRSIQLMTATLFSSTFFSSNLQIIFYKQDYFDPNVKTNPYLHLWSLGVQQQFYMVWPLIVVCLVFYVNMSKRMVFLIMFSLTSFYINIKYIRTNDKISFYFPLARFWEMSIGGILAFMNWKITNTFVSNLLSILSTVGICVGATIITQINQFPGYWALIPTLCTAVTILCQNSFINKKILSFQPIVLIGKISYSLYLWHWPLLVYSRLFYPQGSTSHFSNPLVIILISLTLSIITYYFVQNPVRYKIKSSKVVFVLLFFMLWIGLGALYLKGQVKNNQLLNQFSNQSTNHQIFQTYKHNNEAKVNVNQVIQKKQTQNNINLISENQEAKQLQKYAQKNIYALPNLQDPKIKQKILNHQSTSTLTLTAQQIKNNIAKKLQPKPAQPKPVQPKPVPAQIKVTPPPQNTPRSVLNKIQQYQLQMLPQPQDFYIKNNRSIPNSSKNKNRKPPTFQKLKLSGTIDPDGGLGKMYLEKRIDKNSKYYMPGTEVFHYFQIANQGKQNQLFIIGDSHAQNINYRFNQLFQQSKVQGKLQTFPTIIMMVDRNQPFWPCRNFFHVVMKYIKQRKPKRVFLLNRWLKYFNFGGPQPKRVAYQELNPPCHQGKRYIDKTFSDFLNLLKVFVDAMKQIKDQGVQVYVAAIDPEDFEFDPHVMVDLNGIIQKNIQPVMMSEFRNRQPNKVIIQNFQQNLKSAGINIIYMSDNYCWQDVCQVTMPSGYSVFKDGTHFSSAFIRTWATAVDFLTQF